MFIDFSFHSFDIELETNIDVNKTLNKLDVLSTIHFPFEDNLIPISNEILSHRHRRPEREQKTLFFYQRKHLRLKTCSRVELPIGRCVIVDVDEGCCCCCERVSMLLVESV